MQRQTNCSPRQQARPELVQQQPARKKAKADAKAKVLASIKVGPKGVYTEDSIRVYLQEIGRIRR